MNNRRSFIKTGIGAAVGIALSKNVLAEVCSFTPAQTTGPFIPDDFPFRDADEGHPFVVTNDRNADLTQVDGSFGIAKGQIIYLRGQIVDDNCRPVPQTTVYLWQADVNGHYNHSEDPNLEGEDPLKILDPNFQYRGIVTADNQGRFQFKTIKPKYYPLDKSDPTFLRTAHIHLGIMKDGFQNLFTQTYFEGDLLEDINEIRRLNKIDILLGEWTGRGAGRRPTGRINPAFLPLIVDYNQENGMDALTGNIRISIHKS